MTQAILTPDNAAERRTPWWNSSEAKAVRRQKSRGSVLDWRLRFVWIQSGAASAVNNVREYRAKLRSFLSRGDNITPYSTIKSAKKQEKNGMNQKISGSCRSSFEKLKFESQFHDISLGGCISYVEVPDMQDNIDAVLAVMKHIYNNIMYAELNTKSDYCQVCGYTGQIQIITDDDGKLIWECPNCGNRNQDKMNVARRTCGYIGTQFWNQGRTQEIKERVLHL